jgi:hypothetical protein
MRRFMTLAAVVFALALAPALFAAELHGIVTGKDGKPAVVSVTLVDAQNAKVGQPVATDKTGAYTFSDIKPGNYTVFVDEKNKMKVFVGPGETRRDFTLK